MKLTSLHQMNTIISLAFLLVCRYGARAQQLQDDEEPRHPVKIDVVTHSQNPTNLGLCHGDCDRDSHCQEGLYCFQRGPHEAVPGCSGGESDPSKTDYCVLKPIQRVVEPTEATLSNPTPTLVVVSETLRALTKLVSYGGSPPASKFPLSICEGDCDKDSHCEADLICFERERNDPVPGCVGNDSSKTDYCIDPNALDVPGDDSDSVVTDYTPGKLTVRKVGLLLSEGLDARLIATSGQKVQYADGASSAKSFHGRPDAGATFPDNRDHNQGGWVYVSNAEMEEQAAGGVGAITFDSQGQIIEYKMILEGTTKNCGGGRTSWETWVSCEEKNGRSGHIYQVDPFGEKTAEQMVQGSEGGQWESFAYDIRDMQRPHFFVTEDHEEGALSRFTPTNPDWSNKWDILHGAGSIDYLVLTFDSSATGGTFDWTSDREAAGQNANANYPHSEGIDVRGSQLLFVCKFLRMIYTLDLDNRTWYRTSTVSGLFDGQPDQLQRLLQNTTDLLYFTEEGNTDAGIHARDENARFYTIMESLHYSGETTGLALSPDGRFMYVAYQDAGKLFCLWRLDGKVFGAERLDIKYHDAQQAGP